MSFWYNETKTAQHAKPTQRVQRKADIPIASLQRLGCSVCPRNKLDGKHRAAGPRAKQFLQTPKMEPEGRGSPRLYLLGPEVTKEEDEAGQAWADDLGAEIRHKLGRALKDGRSNHIAQCSGHLDEGPQDATVALHCCRSRIIADIEESRPTVVVGVGDAVLRWATDLTGSALVFSGTLIATQFGSHRCWFYPIASPNYVYKKKRRDGQSRSEYELALAKEVDWIVDALQELEPPKVYGAPFDLGIEYITGQEPGDFERLERALQELASLPEVAIDFETNCLHPHNPVSSDGKRLDSPHIWTCAIGTFDRVVAFSVDHPEGWATEARRAQVYRLLGDFLMRSGSKAAHHLGMELGWVHYFYGELPLRTAAWDDTMAMAHTFDARPGTKSLDVQCRIRFGFFLKAQSRVESTRLLEYPIKDALRYNALDSKWTYLLSQHYKPRLAADDTLRAIYERKVRTASTLVVMEAIGLPVDFEFMEAQDKKLAASLADIERKVQQCREVQEFGKRFGRFEPTNANHVLRLMRDVCERDEVRVEERDGTVRWTSDEDALARIPAREVPSARKILEHRALAKLRSTYVTPTLERKIVCPDGRIRSTYSQMTAVTDRLASQDPNIQNWPKRKHKEIRAAIVAQLAREVAKAELMWLLACDYGQIEFRVVGMASEDDNLVRYCWTGYDVHKFWAERMVQEYPAIKDYIAEEFEVDWDEKGLKTLRQEAKNGWVFPQLFGSSTRSCAEQLHLPEDIAEDLAREFWDEFPGVKRWQNKLLQSYERNLYVETLGGHRRRGPMTKNEIINLPIQGTAAEIVIAGMNAVGERSFLEGRPYMHPALNVHDDLTFIVPDLVLDPTIGAVVHEMCMPRFAYINVPLVVEVSVGKNWAALEEIGKYRSDELFGTRNPYATEKDRRRGR